ncbi:hypothetical protein [Ekhidna sp. To15]|uniref:hypothetical protein n=1 Tax=Ekhidna sp. To15 TaxID=3395267 RepID=UPI003F51F314
MNKRQIKKLEMMRSTNGYLDGTSATWNAIPIASNYKTGLAQIIHQIRTSAEDQEAAQVFIGGTLLDTKQRIAEKLDILDDVLEAYAEDTENPELLVQSSNSKSDYLRLANEEFETKASHVIDLLESHVTNMADYGLTQDQIEDVKLDFGTYQDQRGKPRSYKIASRSATQSIESLMDEGNLFLEKLDRVMKRFKRSNPSFYIGYLSARTIIG